MDKLIEKIAEAPAVALERTIDGSKRIKESLVSHKSVKKASTFWKNLGPGLTTGAADDDPSGIATYSQAGASFGFTYLWLSAFTFPLMSIVQEMCARIGLATGQGLAANIRSFYPRWVLYLCAFLLFAANSFNIGADLGAMAKAMQLLNPSLHFGLLVLFFALLSLILQIFLTYADYAKYLKWLALILLSYVITAFMIRFDAKELITGALIPSITPSKDHLFIICAILGTTISPYLFFWQTSQEVEEEILKGNSSIRARQEEVTRKHIHNMRVDVWSGMFLSNLVMFFIIAVCAATLFKSGVGSIKTAADAANALRPLAGEQAYLLFTLGIIGTGMLAVPVLAGSASYALSESFRWKVGLYRKLKQAYAFYGVIIISMLVGFGINFIGVDPIKVLVYSAVLNGMIAPLILFLIVQLASNKNIMGQWVNSELTSAFGFVITIIMTAVGLLTLISFFV